MQVAYHLSHASFRQFETILQGAFATLYEYAIDSLDRMDSSSSLSIKLRPLADRNAVHRLPWSGMQAAGAHRGICQNTKNEVLPHKFLLKMCGKEESTDSDCFSRVGK